MIRIKLPEVNSLRWKNPKPLRREEWKRIELGGDVLRVSNYGRIKKWGRGILTQCLDGRNYYKVDIGGKHISVARIVCGAFHENPENKRCVDHINGNRHDNRADNLRWVTHSENSRNPNTRFIQKGTKRIEQYCGGELIAIYGSIRYAAEMTGIPRATIGNKLLSGNGRAAIGKYVFVDASGPAKIPTNFLLIKSQIVDNQEVREPLNNLKP